MVANSFIYYEILFISNVSLVYLLETYFKLIKLLFNKFLFTKLISTNVNWHRDVSIKIIIIKLND